MKPDKVINILDDEIGSADGRVELFKQIGALCELLEGNYWRISSVVDEFNELYRKLGRTNRRLVLDAKKDLEKLATREKTQRRQLRTDAKSIISGPREKILNSEYTADFIRRSVARRNVQARTETCQNILSKLNNLRRSLRVSSFDPANAQKVISSGSFDWIQSYAANLVWHLVSKGWKSEDIDNLPKLLRRTNKDIPLRIAEFALQPKHSYRYLIFLPDMIIDPAQPRVFDDGSAIIYPAGFLSTSMLYKSQELPTHEWSLISDTLANNTCIALSVEGFGRHEAARNAIDETHKVLDACSYAHQAADLRLPEYTGQFRRVRWNRTYDSHPLTELSDKGYPTILDESRSRAANQVYEIANDDRELANRLSRALRLLRRSNQLGPTIDSVINQIACLETLVAQGESNKEYIVDSAIFLSGITIEDESKIRSRIRTLYNRRNAALHDGDTEINNSSVINRAQRSLQNILSAIIGRIYEYIQNNPNADMDDVNNYVMAEIKHKYRAVGLKLYRDGISPSVNYRLEGEFVNESGTRVVDARGNLQVEHLDRYFVIECDYHLNSYDTSTELNSREKVWLEAEVNGRPIKLGPVSGMHAMFPESSYFSVRDYTLH